jgi:succinoglycan biosynthesis protein ExoV
MKIFYYNTNTPNFGDELNPWLWPKIFGDVFSETHDELFIGIGSTLWGHIPRKPRKIVFGAGYGYGTPPDVHDGSWDIRFVRGPQTAAKLGIDPKLALTDAAILIRSVPLPPPGPEVAVAFMPHFRSLERGNWPAVCARAGIKLIDPRDPVETVLAQLRGTRLLLTEAMHGAIVADCLRVPWVPLLPIVADHRMKWLDWTQTIGVPYAPVDMRGSSARELWIQATGNPAKGRRSLAVAASPVGTAIDAVAIRLAARRLREIAAGQSYLSTDATIESLTDRALEHVAKLKAELAIAPR